MIAGSIEFAPPFWRAILALATLAGRRVPNSATSERINARPAGSVLVAFSFRKAFHIIGKDNLKHDGGEEPPLRPVVGGCRADMRCAPLVGTAVTAATMRNQ